MSFGHLFNAALQEIAKATKFIESFDGLQGSEGMQQSFLRLKEVKLNAMNTVKQAAILQIESMMVVSLGLTDRSKGRKVLEKQKEKLIGTGDDDLREEMVQPLLMAEVNKTLAWFLRE